MKFQQNKSIILFDIDRTLFDTDTFKHLFQTKLADITGVATEDMKQLLELYYSTLGSKNDFSPAEYSQFIATKTNCDVARLWSVFFEDHEMYKQCVFPEVRQALDTLQETHRLGIFSEGMYQYQVNKLMFTGLLSYFEPSLTFILSRKLHPNNIELLPESTVIDDLPEAMESFSHNSKIKVVWMNRKGLENTVNWHAISKLTDLR